MKIQAVVELTVSDDDPSEPPLQEKQLRGAATEALVNALRFASEVGFQHRLHDRITVDDYAVKVVQCDLTQEMRS